ncbi:MAG: LysR family transcriptional regulator [Alsobacter sp.]
MSEPVSQAAPSPARPLPVGGRAGLTLHQLQIFCAVAQAQTLTKAGKQLELAQPSISQQISKLERSVGVRLFERTNTRMVLTDAGHFLLRRALHILSAVDEAEAGLLAFAEGSSGVVRVAGVNSVLRHLLPPALASLEGSLPGIEVHVHEVSPSEALDLLYSRRVTVGLIASNSVSQSSVGFTQRPVVSDPYVLVTPDWLDLAAVRDPATELDERARRVLDNCIQFNFGTQHTQRVEDWFNRILPSHRVIARCRSYEVAIDMVRAGLGVCLAPAMTATDDRGVLQGVRLWRSGLPDRSTVAMFPAQYARVEPVRSFLAAIEAAGRRVPAAQGDRIPPFIALCDGGWLPAE